MVNPDTQTPQDTLVTTAEPQATTAKFVYILYLVGLFVGLTMLVGLVVAYMNRSDAPAWLRSHYTFQIRTFWLSLLWFVIGAVLTLVLIGWLVFLIWYVWVITRCVKGLKLLGQGQPYPRPETWGFT